VLDLKSWKFFVILFLISGAPMWAMMGANFLSGVIPVRVQYRQIYNAIPFQEYFLLYPGYLVVVLGLAFKYFPHHFKPEDPN
jgi:hypothetical protein